MCYRWWYWDVPLPYSISSVPAWTARFSLSLSVSLLVSQSISLFLSRSFSRSAELPSKGKLSCDFYLLFIGLSSNTKAASKVWHDSLLDSLIILLGQFGFHGLVGRVLGSGRQRCNSVPPLALLPGQRASVTDRYASSSVIAGMDGHR